VLTHERGFPLSERSLSFNVRPDFIYRKSSPPTQTRGHVPGCQPSVWEPEEPLWRRATAPVPSAAALAGRCRGLVGRLCAFGSHLFWMQGQGAGMLLRAHWSSARACLNPAQLSVSSLGASEGHSRYRSMA